MKSLLALTLTAAIATAGVCAFANEPAPASSKPDLAKAQEKATQVCGACHTFDGTRGLPANPILQGQHADYIVKQLTEFKSGKRANPVMTAMAAALTDDDVRNLAAFYSGKQAKPGFSKSKDTVLLGEKIYRGGIAAKQVPACAGCHSPNGAGIPAQFPRVGGQHADYTEAQLNAFRAGTRSNGPMMVTIASRMSDKEIKAVADYMAGLR
jgi:cytochrome c553